jgi:hypothetical protein
LREDLCTLTFGEGKGRIGKERPVTEERAYEVASDISFDNARGDVILLIIIVD